jgi:hypothetical protein
MYNYMNVQEIVMDSVWADIGLTMLGLAGVLLVYTIPAFIAFIRYHTRFRTILALNVVFGWTAVGWVGLLVWAFSKNTSNRSNTSVFTDSQTGEQQIYHTRPL